MHPSRRYQESHMDSNIFPRPPSTSNGNPVGDVLRENHFTRSDQPTYSPASAMGFGFSRGPSDNLNGVFRNGVANTFANQSEEIFYSRNRNENECRDQNSFVAPWRPNDLILHETSGNAVYTSLGQFQPVQWEQLSHANVSTVLPQLKGHVNQLKAYESSEISPNSHIEGQAKGFPREQSGHLNSSLDVSGDLHKQLSRQPLFAENLQIRFRDPRMSSVGVGGQVCCQESSNIQEMSDAYGGLYSSNPSTNGGKLAEFHDEHVNDTFVQNQLQINSGCAGGFWTSNPVKVDTGMEKTLSSSSSSLIQPLNEETSAKKVETDLDIHGHDWKSEEQTSYILADDNLASKASEKLWSGTLKLSSTVKLSAASYFRSGDKMPEIYWPDPLEVKGKVKLEALEKYIQDLPRSRNRGLMVMSLYLREGSSKDELQGMNVVIKKYISGKRVGLARLSSGVDFYICPNSEMVINILAKNGFSKDLVAVQDHQDSLIGCAVWRKNTSSPNSNPQQVTGSDSSSAKPKAKTIQKTAAKAPATYLGNTLGESNTVGPSPHLSSSSGPSPAASANSHSSTMDGQTFPPSNLHAIHSIVKQLTDIETSIFQSLGIEKHQGNLELLRTLIPLSSEVVKQQPAPATDDDDLPEYDFGAAAPHASASNPLTVNANKKALNVEEFRPNNESMVSNQMCAESQKDVYGGSLPQKRKVQEVDSESTRLPIGHNRPIMTTTQTTDNINTMLGSKTRNLFDEDDMPEWTPPDMNHFKPPTDQTTRLPFISNTFRPPPHSGAANPTSSPFPAPRLPGPPPSNGLHHPIAVTAQMALPPPPLLPPLPPGPPPFRPDGRPQHRPYNTGEPSNQSRWNRR